MNVVNNVFPLLADRVKHPLSFFDHVDHLGVKHGVVLFSEVVDLCGLIHWLVPSTVTYQEMRTGSLNASSSYPRERIRLLCHQWELAPDHLLQDRLHQLTLIERLSKSESRVQLKLTWAHGSTRYSYKKIRVKHALVA